jgi:putative oxidoreductase
MGIIYKFECWGNAHRALMLDMIRLLLGVFLVVKGDLFLQDSSLLRELIIQDKWVNPSWGTVNALTCYVTYIHLIGGTLVFLGISTRLAAFVQLPVLLGAVFLVNTSSFVNMEWWLSLLVLALLILFTIIGPGPLSLDRILPAITNQRMRL